MKISPNVFISYSHDSDEFKAWIAKLAADLRSHGINVILDQWDLRIGGDLRFFMEQGLSNSVLVICVCSDTYVQKSNKGSGGTGYESMIMTQVLLKNTNTEFIIPIIRNNNSESKTPLALGSKIYIDFSDDAVYLARYQELLERIYNEDMKKKPKLGENPFSSPMAIKIAIKTNIESVKYRSLEMSGQVRFRFDNNSGNYILGVGEYEFATHWSRSGNNSIYASGKIGFLPEAIALPKFSELANFDYTSTTRTIHTGQIVIWQNNIGHFAAIKLGDVNSSSHGHPYDEMTFDYKIYDGVND